MSKARQGALLRTARRYNHSTGCITLTTERHAHREDNRREVLRWLHLLVAEGHRAYPSEPRPELGLAWGPDGRRIDILPWAGPDEGLDRDAGYGSEAETASDTESASEAEHASAAERSGGERGQSKGAEGEAAEEELEVREGERHSSDASGGEAAGGRDAGAEEEGPDGGAAHEEEIEIEGVGAAAGLGSDAAEHMGGSEAGVGTSGDGDDFPAFQQQQKG